jgi:NAD(P)-dependent dehydrogenase (short-subunit alcohol dehydrogenase family)
VVVEPVIWISGASSGIGAALARSAPPGSRVIGISRRPSARGESHIADLSQPESWSVVGRHIEGVLEQDRPEQAMLLHFAGVATPLGPAVAAGSDAYRDAVLVNSAAGQVLGKLFLAACHRLQIRPTVVMCSSPAAATARAGMAHYSAGKAALEQWARAAALEQASVSRPGAVFSVVPYGVDTPLLRQTMEAPAEDVPLGELFRAAAAEGRLADPDATAREIWQLVAQPAEPGSAVPVGAVPSAVS